MFKYRLPAYANTIKQLRLFYLAAHSEGLHAHTLKCTPRIKASHKNESRSFEVNHTLLHSTHVRRALQQQFCSQCSGKPLPCHCQSQRPHSSHTLRVHCSGAQLLLEVSRTFVLIQKKSTLYFGGTLPRTSRRVWVCHPYKNQGRCFNLHCKTLRTQAIDFF